MKEAIIKLINKWACSHKWKLHQRMSSYNNGDTTKTPVYVKDTLICESCGKIKKIKL